MEIRNARYNAVGTIDCEVEHPVHGWIPFTASPDDAEQHGRDIFAQVSATADPYVDPGPQAAPVPQTVSAFQAFQALADFDLLDVAEAAIAQADAKSQRAFHKATEFRRTSPTVLAIATALGITETELDDLFRHAADIEA